MPWNLLTTDTEISPKVLEDLRAADDGCLIAAQAYSYVIHCFHVPAYHFEGSQHCGHIGMHYEAHHQQSGEKSHLQASWCARL